MCIFNNINILVQAENQEKKRQKRMLCTKTKGCYTQNDAIHQKDSLHQEKHKQAFENISSEQDELDAYVLTVEAKLRKMNSQQRTFAENMINQILYKGLMNELRADTQTVETPPTPSVQNQTLTANVQQPLISHFQQSQLQTLPQVPQQQPLIAMNITSPQFQRPFPFQNQIIQSVIPNALPGSISTVLPTTTTGQIGTTQLSSTPVVISNISWGPSVNSGI